MATDTAADRPPGGRHAVRPSGRTTPAYCWPLLVVVGWAAQVALRLWVAAGSGSMPTANVDEIGYLGAARMFAGHGRGGLDLSGNIVYRGGYALLLVPDWLINQDPHTVYRLVQVEDALLGALLFPLAWLLGGRCGLTRPTAFWVASLAAALPSATFFSAYALTDSVLPVLVLAWLLCCHSWLTATRRAAVAASGTAAAALAGWSNAVHSRGAVIVTVEGCLILLAGARRWRTPMQCAVAGSALLGSLGAGLVLNRELQHRLYPSGTGDLGGVVGTHLRTFDGLGWTTRVSVGQIWYQFAVTGGLAAIGLILLVHVALRRSTPRSDRLMAAAIVATTLGIAGLSAAALRDGHRIGNNAFGRYLACLCPVLVVFGAAALLRARRAVVLRLVGAAAGLIVLGGAVVRFSLGRSLPTDAFVAFDFPEPSAFARDYYHFHVFRVIAVALALLAAATVVSRVPRVGPAALAGLLIVTSVFVVAGARSQIIAPPGRIYPIAHLSPTPGPPPTLVALDERIAWWIRLTMVYEQRWPRVQLFDGSRQAPPAGADRVFFTWNNRQPRASTWPTAPPKSHVVAANSTGEADQGWVEWRRA